MRLRGSMGAEVAGGCGQGWGVEGEGHGSGTSLWVLVEVLSLVVLSVLAYASLEEDDFGLIVLELVLDVKGRER